MCRSPIATYNITGIAEGIASIDVRRQLFAAVVPSYHNVSLLGSYQNRSNPLYMVKKRTVHET